MAEELRFELLGGIHITRDREPVVGFMSNKALALLCYLAVTARPHQRDFLAGVFWGESSDADAKASLRRPSLIFANCSATTWRLTARPSP